MYLIDSICKSWIQNNSRKYIELFERNIVSTFVRIYIQSSHSEILKRRLRLLRMTWRQIFQENLLQEMRVKILDIEKEDIDCNFSDEDFRKLYEYYKKNDISLELLPKLQKKHETVPVSHINSNSANLNMSSKTPQKRVKNPIDEPKIKKKIKKNTNNNEINTTISMKTGNNNNSLMSLKPNNVQNFPNPSQNNANISINNANIKNNTAIYMNKIPTQNPFEINDNKNHTNIISFNSNNNNNNFQNKNLNLENNFEKSLATTQNKTSSLNMTPTTNNNNNVITNPNPMIPNSNNFSKKPPDDKKTMNAKDNLNELSKEKLKNLISPFLKEKNAEIFFYILYKNFKDEMSRQFPKKTVQLSNIKM